LAVTDIPHHPIRRTVEAVVGFFALMVVTFLTRLW
jgi:hypothetical protein